MAILRKVLMLAVFFVALVAAHQGVQYFMAPTPAEKAEAIHKGLQAAADQQRPSLPRRLDETTMLTDISVTGQKLTYVYEIEDSLADRIRSGALDVENGVRQAVCKSEMKTTVEAGGMFGYEYWTKGKAAKVSDVTVDRFACLGTI